MGNAAIVKQRQRVLLEQYNKNPHALVSNVVLRARSLKQLHQLVGSSIPIDTFKNGLEMIGCDVENELFSPLIEFLTPMDKTQVWLASKRGDLNTVRRAIELQGFPIQLQDAFNNTILYYACLCGHIDIVHYAFTRQAKSIPPAELDRCTINALSNDIRLYLQQKKTYQQVIAASNQKEQQDENDTMGLAMFLVG